MKEEPDFWEKKISQTEKELTKTLACKFNYKIRNKRYFQVNPFEAKNSLINGRRCSIRKSAICFVQFAIF